MLICIKQHQISSFEAQIMKTLSNIEAELKKSVAYKTKAFKQSGTFIFPEKLKL